MHETFSWITNDSAERIRKTHAENHCLTGESSLFQTSFPPPPCATHANSLRETNVASPRPVSRPTHRPLTCTSINLPAHRAPRPPVHLNPDRNRKHAHLQVHQSICPVWHAINNLPFHRLVPRISSFVFWAHDTNNAAAASRTLSAPDKKCLCASGVQTPTDCECINVNAELNIAPTLFCSEVRWWTNMMWHSCLPG